MKWSELPLKPSAKALRQFAGAWLVFFSLWGLQQWFGKSRAELGQVLCIIAVVIGVLGLIKPPAVRWLFVTWMMLAFPIGWVISQIALLILFYGMITPVALFFRLRGRDLLSRKPAPERGTFWVDKSNPSDTRGYFNQY
jgi:hypothetical protein